ncbi:unnamed protein product [Ixodes persulcatus]
MADTGGQVDPGIPVLGRWAVGACEAFVIQLYQVLRMALALFYSVFNAPKICPGTATGGFTTVNATDELPCLPLLGSRSSTISAGLKKTSLRCSATKTGAGMAILSKMRTSQIPVRTQVAQRRQVTSSTSSVIQNHVLGRTHPGNRLDRRRSNDSKSVLHWQGSVVTSKQITPKASVSAPTPVAIRRKFSQHVASSSATATVAPSCRTKEASDLVTLRKQAAELVRALVIVFVLIANMCISLVNCVYRYRYLKWFSVPTLKTNGARRDYCLRGLPGLHSKCR